MKVKLATMLFVCFLCFATCGMGEINPDSIISAWLFDEGKGDTVNDLSTAKHHGSVKKPKWVKGKFGSALEFDGKPGSMDYVLIEENIGTFSEMTFCAWGIYTGNVGKFRMVWANNGWAGGDLHHQIRPPNDLVWAVNGDGGHLFSTIFFDDKQKDKWWHFATVYSTEKKVRKYYINGKPDKSDDKATVKILFGPGRLGSWDGGGREWMGILDEIIVFNTVLEQEDIQMIMKQGVAKTLSVDQTGKLTTTWANIKSPN